MAKDDATPAVDTGDRASKMLEAFAAVDEGGVSEVATPVVAAPVDAVAEIAPEPVVVTPEVTQPEGVLLKDGKTVLPYEKLLEARREANASRAELKAAQAKLAEFEAAIADANDGGLPEIPDLSALEVPDELKQPLQAMRAHLVALSKQNKALQTESETRAQENERLQQERAESEYFATLNAKTDKGVDQFPILKALETTKGPRYEQAKAISNSLLSDPVYAEKMGTGELTRAQHFADVESGIRDAAIKEAHLFGLVPQAAAKPAVVAKPAPTAAAKPLPVVTQPTPGSLSDIPGGAAPATNEAEAFLQQDDFTAVANMAKIKQKNPSQFDAYMSRVYR